MPTSSVNVRVGVETDTASLKRTEAQIRGTLDSINRFNRQGIGSRQFTQPLGKITASADEFTKSLEASNARVLAFGASAGAIYAVQSAMQALVRTTIQVEKEMADINVILGASTGNLKRFGDQLFDIAGKTGQSFRTVAEAAKELSRQGLGIEKTLQRTHDAMILARLGGMEATAAVESLTAAINTFDSAALNSTRIINKMANVDAAFAVSTEDLAEAIKRVGSSAKDAGLSFDQMLAAVTTAQQKTARGGRVIGNSLKTIFTRVQRPRVIQQFEQLGVTVRDMEGNVRPAMGVLQDFAKVYDNLSDSQKAYSAELLGGVFQINVLKAVMSDLGKEMSIYNRALKTSISSTDQAISRNEELNKTLAALTNETLQNLVKWASEVGKVTFGPAIEKVLKKVNAVIEALTFEGKESLAASIGKGFLAGLGKIIEGPGLILITGLIAKLGANFVKFSITAVKTFTGLNKSAKEHEVIQNTIQNILLKNPQIIDKATQSNQNLLVIEKQLNDTIKKRSDYLLESERISKRMAANIQSGNVAALAAPPKRSGKRPKTAKGLIPNLAVTPRDRTAEVLGAAANGYKITGRDVRETKIDGLGEVVYNRKEKIKQFPGMSQPAIIPPRASRAGQNYKEQFQATHGFNPYSSQGHIPNFALHQRKVGRYRTKSIRDKADRQDDLLAKITVDRMGKSIGAFRKEADAGAKALIDGKKLTPRVEQLMGLGRFSGGREFDPTIKKKIETSIANYRKKPTPYRFLNIKNQLQGGLGEMSTLNMYKGRGNRAEKILGHKPFDYRVGGTLGETRTRSEVHITDIMKKAAMNLLAPMDSSVYKNQRKDRIPLNKGGRAFRLSVPRDTKIIKSGGFVPNLNAYTQMLGATQFSTTRRADRHISQLGLRETFGASTPAQISGIYPGKVKEPRNVGFKKTVSGKPVGSVETYGLRNVTSGQFNAALSAAYPNMVSKLGTMLFKQPIPFRGFTRDGGPQVRGRVWEDMLAGMTQGPNPSANQKIDFRKQKIRPEFVQHFTPGTQDAMSRGLEARGSFSQLSELASAKGRKKMMSGGFVPNLARKVLDSDYLRQWSSDHPEQYKALKAKYGVTNVQQLFDHIAMEAGMRGQLGSVINAPTGLGKTTLAMGSKGSMINSLDQLNKGDNLVIVKAAEARSNMQDKPWWGLQKRYIHLEGKADEIHRRRELRDAQIKAGVAPTAFGRKAGSTKGAGTDFGVMESIVAEEIGKRPGAFRSLRTDSNFKLTSVPTSSIPLPQTRAAAMTMGAFTPPTLGHDRLFKQIQQSGLFPYVGIAKGTGRDFDIGLSLKEKTKLLKSAYPGINFGPAPFGRGAPDVVRFGDDVTRFDKPKSNVYLGSDRFDDSVGEGFRKAGFNVKEVGRASVDGLDKNNLSATKVREAIVNNKVKNLRSSLNPQVYRFVEENQSALRYRADMLSRRQDRIKSLEGMRVSILKKMGLNKRLDARSPKRKEFPDLAQQHDLLKSRKDAMTKKSDRFLSIIRSRSPLAFNSGGYIPNFARPMNVVRGAQLRHKTGHSGSTGALGDDFYRGIDSFQGLLNVLKGNAYSNRPGFMSTAPKTAQGKQLAKDFAFNTRNTYAREAAEAGQKTGVFEFQAQHVINRPFLEKYKKLAMAKYNLNGGEAEKYVVQKLFETAGLGAKGAQDRFVKRQWLGGSGSLHSRFDTGRYGKAIGFDYKQLGVGHQGENVRGGEIGMMAFSRHAKGLDGRQIMSSGNIPNFNALESALGREKKAGFSDSQLRVGFDSRLKASGGLGVYNSSEGSLKHAIGLHRASGKSMKDIETAGVPNYANPNPFLESIRRAGVPLPTESIKTFKNEINQANELMKRYQLEMRAGSENTATTRKELNKLAKTIGVSETNLTKMDTTFQNMEQKVAVGMAGDPAGRARAQSEFIKSGTGTHYDLGDNRMVGKSGELSDEHRRASGATKDPTPKRSKTAASMSAEAKMMRGQGIGMGLMFAPAMLQGFMSSGDDASKSERISNARMERIMNSAMVAGGAISVAPMLGGTDMAEYKAGQKQGGPIRKHYNTLGQQVKKAGNLAAKHNVAIAAVAAGFTYLASAQKQAQAEYDDTPELKKAFEMLKEMAIKSGDSLAQFLAVQEKIVAAETGDRPISPHELAQAQKERTKILMNMPEDVREGVKKALSEGRSLEEIQASGGEILQKQGERLSRSALNLRLEELANLTVKPEKVDRMTEVVDGKRQLTAEGEGYMQSTAQQILNTLTNKEGFTPTLTQQGIKDIFEGGGTDTQKLVTLFRTMQKEGGVNVDQKLLGKEGVENSLSEILKGLGSDSETAAIFTRQLVEALKNGVDPANALTTVVDNSTKKVNAQLQAQIAWAKASEKLNKELLTGANNLKFLGDILKQNLDTDLNIRASKRSQAIEKGGVFAQPEIVENLKSLVSFQDVNDKRQANILLAQNAMMEKANQINTALVQDIQGLTSGRSGGGTTGMLPEAYAANTAQAAKLRDRGLAVGGAFLDGSGNFNPAAGQQELSNYISDLREARASLDTELKQKPGNQAIKDEINALNTAITSFEDLIETTQTQIDLQNNNAANQGKVIKENLRRSLEMMEINRNLKEGGGLQANVTGSTITGVRNAMVQRATAQHLSGEDRNNMLGTASLGLARVFKTMGSGAIPPDLLKEIENSAAQNIQRLYNETGRSIDPLRAQEIAQQQVQAEFKTKPMSEVLTEMMSADKTASDEQLEQMSNTAESAKNIDANTKGLFNFFKGLENPGTLRTSEQKPIEIKNPDDIAKGLNGPPGIPGVSGFSGSQSQRNLVQRLPITFNKEISPLTLPSGPGKTITAVPNPNLFPRNPRFNMDNKATMPSNMYFENQKRIEAQRRSFEEKVPYLNMGQDMWNRTGGAIATEGGMFGLKSAMLPADLLNVIDSALHWAVPGGKGFGDRFNELEEDPKSWTSYFNPLTYGDGSSTADVRRGIDMMGQDQRANNPFMGMGIKTQLSPDGSGKVRGATPWNLTNKQGQKDAVNNPFGFITSLLGEVLTFEKAPLQALGKQGVRRGQQALGRTPKTPPAKLNERATGSGLEDAKKALEQAKKPGAKNRLFGSGKLAMQSAGTGFMAYDRSYGLSDLKEIQEKLAQEAKEGSISMIGVEEFGKSLGARFDELQTMSKPEAIKSLGGENASEAFSRLLDMHREANVLWGKASDSLNKGDAELAKRLLSDRKITSTELKEIQAAAEKMDKDGDSSSAERLRDSIRALKDLKSKIHGPELYTPEFIGQFKSVEDFKGAVKAQFGNDPTKVPGRDGYYQNPRVDSKGEPIVDSIKEIIDAQRKAEPKGDRGSRGHKGASGKLGRAASFDHRNVPGGRTNYAAIAGGNLNASIRDSLINAKREENIFDSGPVFVAGKGVAKLAELFEGSGKIKPPSGTNMVDAFKSGNLKQILDKLSKGDADVRKALEKFLKETPMEEFGPSGKSTGRTAVPFGKNAIEPKNLEATIKNFLLKPETIAKMRGDKLEGAKLNTPERMLADAYDPKYADRIDRILKEKLDHLTTDEANEAIANALAPKVKPGAKVAPKLEAPKPKPEPTPKPEPPKKPKTEDMTPAAGRTDSPTKLAEDAAKAAEAEAEAAAKLKKLGDEVAELEKAAAKADGRMVKLNDEIAETSKEIDKIEAKPAGDRTAKEQEKLEELTTQRQRLEFQKGQAEAAARKADEAADALEIRKGETAEEFKLRQQKVRAEGKVKGVDDALGKPKGGLVDRIKNFGTDNPKTAIAATLAAPLLINKLMDWLKTEKPKTKPKKDEESLEVEEGAVEKPKKDEDKDKPKTKPKTGVDALNEAEAKKVEEGKRRMAGLLGGLKKEGEATAEQLTTTLKEVKELLGSGNVDAAIQKLVKSGVFSEKAINKFSGADQTANLGPTLAATTESLRIQGIKMQELKGVPAAFEKRFEELKKEETSGAQTEAERKAGVAIAQKRLNEEMAAKGLPGLEGMRGQEFIDNVLKQYDGKRDKGTDVTTQNALNRAMKQQALNIANSTATEEEKRLMTEELRDTFMELSKSGKEFGEIMQELTLLAAEQNYEQTQRAYMRGEARTSDVRAAGEAFRRQQISKSGKFAPEDMFANLQDQMSYDMKDFADDVMTTQNQLIANFKQGTTDALFEAIKGTAKLKDAFGAVFQNLADVAMKRTLQMAVDGFMNAVFNSIPQGFSEGGEVQKFARGGMVRGGSGVRDDVPAMLQRGEYVLRKSAVRKYGPEFIQRLNEGGMAGEGMPRPEMIPASEMAAQYGAEMGKVAKTRPGRNRMIRAKGSPKIQRFASGGLALPTGLKQNPLLNTMDEELKIGSGISAEHSGWAAENLGEMDKLIKSGKAKASDDPEAYISSKKDLQEDMADLLFKNTYAIDHRTRPTKGKFNVEVRKDPNDPNEIGLSALALTDPDNPHNDFKFERYEALMDYLKAREDHVKAHEQAVKDWKERRKRNMKAAFINTGLSIGMSMLAEGMMNWARARQAGAAQKIMGDVTNGDGSINTAAMEKLPPKDLKKLEKAFGARGVFGQHKGAAGFSKALRNQRIAASKDAGVFKRMFGTTDYKFKTPQRLANRFKFNQGDYGVMSGKKAFASGMGQWWTGGDRGYGGPGASSPFSKSPTPRTIGRMHDRWEGTSRMPIQEQQWEERNTGGMIRNAATVGTDNVPAMLTGGEYVVNKKTVQKYGPDFFERLNAGAIRGFQNGGYVGGVATNSMAGGEAASAAAMTNNVSIVVNVDSAGRATTATNDSGGNASATEEERSRKLANMIQNSVTQTIMNEKRPGGLLYGGS